MCNGKGEYGQNKEYYQGIRFSIYQASDSCFAWTYLLFVSFSSSEHTDTYNVVNSLYTEIYLKEIKAVQNTFLKRVY